MRLSVVRHIKDWCGTHLIADDPCPQLSRLDRYDGLTGPDDHDDYDQIDYYLNPAKQRRTVRWEQTPQP